MDVNVLLLSVGGGLAAAFLVMVLVVVRSLRSSRPIQHCRGCGDPIPERSMTGRCWRCGLPYADLSRFMDGRDPGEGRQEPERPGDPGFRTDASDVTDPGRN
jgi:hypothetical protein